MPYDTFTTPLFREEGILIYKFVSSCSPTVLIMQPIVLPVSQCKARYAEGSLARAEGP